MEALLRLVANAKTITVGKTFVLTFSNPNLKSLLIKIENAINLLNHTPPRHIPAYNKMLGVQQKIVGLNQEQKNIMFSQLVICRAVINYFMNGRYKEAQERIIELKTSIVMICFGIEKNESDKDREI